MATSPLSCLAHANRQSMPRLTLLSYSTPTAVALRTHPLLPERTPGLLRFVRPIHRRVRRLVLDIFRPLKSRLKQRLHAVAALTSFNTHSDWRRPCPSPTSSSYFIAHKQHPQKKRNKFQSAAGCGVNRTFTGAPAPHFHQLARVRHESQYTCCCCCCCRRRVDYTIHSV